MAEGHQWWAVPQPEFQFRSSRPLDNLREGTGPAVRELATEPDTGSTTGMLLSMALSIGGGVLALARFVCPESSKGKTKTDEDNQEEPEHLALVKIQEVREALRNLGVYSKVVDADGRRVLAYLSKHSKEISYWIKVANGAVECLNLVRYLYKQLDRAVESQKKDDSSKNRDVHIVLVGDGSITNQVRSSSSFVPLKTITDTILYSPWNCAIDPKVTYGISAGCILPHHRAFRNGEPQGPLPGHWNSMAAQRGTGVPEIILGPLKTDLDGILKITAIAAALLKNPDRVVLLYPSEDVFPVLPKAMPLSQLVAIVAFLFMFQPSCKATIHLAAGLEYRGRTPPDVNMWQALYAYTPNGTVMTLQNTELSDELFFREMTKTAEVHDVLGNLGQYSNTIDTNGRKVLESLSNLPCEISPWIKAAGNAILCLNLVRYIYTQLSQAADPQNRDLHIVLVGDGSIANQAHPASWLLPLETITDTILYSPWNCAIDAKVAYGISTGCILPGHRDFRNWEPQEALPEDWNSMAAQQRTGVPEIILGPMTTDADWIAKVTALADCVALLKNHKRLVIPYPPGLQADLFPAVPLHLIITVIAYLLKFIPPYKATIHLAAGLEFRGRHQPDVEMGQYRYTYTPSGTVMTAQNMELSSDPMLYSLLSSMFSSTQTN